MFENLNEDSTVLLSNILIIILCFVFSVAVRFSIMHVLLAVIDTWFLEEQSGNIKNKDRIFLC